MKKIFVLFFVCSVLSGTLLFSETLEQILAKNYESRGGLKKLKAIKTVVFEGKIFIPMQNLEFPVKMCQKKPNKLKMEATVMEKKIVQGYDGKKAWYINPMMGSEDPQEMTEDQAKEAIQQAESIDPLVDYKEMGCKLEYSGKEDMEGTEVYKLKMTRKDGRVEMFYLDTESGIELRTSSNIKRGESEILSESLFGDYKEVEGIMFPFAIEIKVNGQTTMKIAVASVKLNEKLEDSLFEMPAKKVEEKKEPEK